jgi:hypothetical protein
MKNLILWAALLLAAPTTSQAAVIQFNLLGKGGSGLLSTNENTAVSATPVPGSGGEILGGIEFDDSSLILTVRTGWGSANGFTNLTGNANAGHLHGPTTDGGTASFTQNAGVKYGLDTLTGWNNSATAGGFNGTVAILPADVPALLAGQFYMNVHTAINGNGEIRGNLVVVPEPSTLLFGAVSLGLLTLRRRR